MRFAALLMRLHKPDVEAGNLADEVRNLAVRGRRALALRPGALAMGPGALKLRPHHFADEAWRLIGQNPLLHSPPRRPEVAFGACLAPCTAITSGCWPPRSQHFRFSRCAARAGAVSFAPVLWIPASRPVRTGFRREDRVVDIRWMAPLVHSCLRTKGGQGVDKSPAADVAETYTQFVPDLPVAFQPGCPARFILLNQRLG